VQVFGNAVFGFRQLELNLKNFENFQINGHDIEIPDDHSRAVYDSQGNR
jgi:hypothetical protein